MILVTGGTGLVGSHLLYQLVEETVPVKAIYRSENKLEKTRRVFSYYSDKADDLFQKVNWVKADLNDLTSLEYAFEDVDLVYHCAAMISFDPNDLQLLVKANEEGTANLVNLCISKNIRKLCYVSSIAALGKQRGIEKITEESEWRNDDINPYALTKYLAEMEVWRGTLEGVSSVIINPGVILGPGFWNSGSGRLFQTAAKGTRYFPPGGTGFITVHDVVSIMMALMNSEYKNERFIAVGENLTYRQILADLAIQLGRPQPKQLISIPILQVLWRLDWIWHLLSGQKRKLSRVQVNSMKHRWIYDSEKIKERIGFEFELIEDRLPSYCEKFKEAYPSLFF